MTIEQVGLLYVAVNLWDWISTEVVVGLGATELNPLMAALIGTPWFLLIKLVTPALIAWWLAGKGREGRVVLWLGVGLTALAALSNTIGGLTA